MAITNSENMAVFSTPICKAKFGEEENKNSNFLFFLLFSFTIFSLFVSWYFFSGSWILRSIVVGNLLIYYSWELIYFDSLRPGVEPASPLSPSHIKVTSRYSCNFNYALATLIGVSLSVFVVCFI